MHSILRQMFVLVAMALVPALAVGCGPKNVEGVEFGEESENNQTGNSNNNQSDEHNHNTSNNTSNNGGNSVGNNWDNNTELDASADPEVNSQRAECSGDLDRTDCDSFGECRWLAPGCAEVEGAPALAEAGCFPAEDCGLDEDCPEGQVCRAVVIDPCLADEEGNVCDACGQEVHACIPEGTCAVVPGEEECGASGCRWLVPGCDEPSLPRQGCYPAEDCAGDDDCPPGTSCREVAIDPCWNMGCNACAGPASVCLP